MDYPVKNKIDNLGYTRLSQIPGELSLPEEFYEGSRFLLVDASISYRFFSGLYSYTYAVEEIKRENEGWNDHLEEDHFLETCTRENFKNDSGSISFTAAFSTDELREESTVHYNTEADTVTCLHCEAPTNVTLTSGGTKIYVCQNLSSADFNSLVQAIAFPQFILVTNDRCLGWSSAPLGSYLLEKNEKIKYSNLWKYRK